MDCAPILREHPLFRNLSAEQMRLVADLAEEHTVPAGAVLSQQADLGATLFIIGEGEAVVHHIDGQGLRRPVGMISAGMIYGVTSLFLQDPRDATVTAASPVRLWTIRREPFQRLLAERPALARRLDVPSEVVRRMRAPVFPWLEPGESVALFTRRHPLSFWRQAAVIAIVAGLCLATLTLTSRLTGWPRNLATWGPLTAAAFALALLWQWLDWRNDYLIVTTRRVAHRERVSLLYESRYEAPLERVQNINIRRGLLGSLFGYGQVSVETAAKAGGLTFSETPRPEQAREAVFAQLARLRATQRATERRHIKEELLARIGEEGPAAAPPTADPDQPLEEHAEPPASFHQPGRLLRALEWLARQGLFPATRMSVDGAIVWRQHWIFLLRGTFGPTLFTVLSAGLAVAGFSGRPVLLAALWRPYPWAMVALAILGVAWFWWEYTDWGNDLYMLSDDRIVDIEKRPLFFSEERREATLGVIQNVSSEMPTFLAAVLNYGDVLVQTAGSGEFTFERVPNPHEVQREIFRRMEAFRERQRREENERRRREFADWLSVYDRVRQQGASEGSGADPSER